MTNRPNRFAVGANVADPGQALLLRQVPPAAADALLVALIATPLAADRDPVSAADALLRAALHRLRHAAGATPPGWERRAIVEAIAAIWDNPASALDLAEIVATARWFVTQAEMAVRR